MHKDKWSAMNFKTFSMKTIMSNHDLELNLCGKDPKAPTEGKQSTPSDFIADF